MYHYTYLELAQQGGTVKVTWVVDPYQPCHLKVRKRKSFRKHFYDDVRDAAKDYSEKYSEDERAKVSLHPAYRVKRVEFLRPAYTQSCIVLTGEQMKKLVDHLNTQVYSEFPPLDAEDFF